jgi:DNA-binding MarR family transcriptional regulator
MLTVKRPDDAEIAANLSVVISRLVKILRKETKNEELLSLTERSTLGLVYKQGEMLPSELAAMEKVTTQSMSQIINKLSKAGYIKKTPSQKDKRKVILTITPAGKKFIDKNRHEKLEWLSKSIFEKTTQKEKEVLVNAIEVLTKLVDLK